MLIYAIARGVIMRLKFILQLPVMMRFPSNFQPKSVDPEEDVGGASGSVEPSLSQSLTDVSKQTPKITGNFSKQTPKITDNFQNKHQRLQVMSESKRR